MDDGRGAVGHCGAEGFETNLGTAGALREIVGGVTEMEDAFAAGFEPFAGVAKAAARLDHFEIEIAPFGEGIAVGEGAGPVAVAAFILGIEAPEWA